MSGASGDAYAAFLRTADVATWRDCMERAVRLVSASPTCEEDFEALAQALCITIYLQWLGGLSGDLAVENDARGHHEALRSTLLRCSSDPHSSALKISWGLDLAWSGYRREAARLLNRGGRVPVEHVLIVLKDGDVSSLTQLRPLFAGPSRCAFLPALAVYGSQLTDAGALREARELLSYGDWDQSEPFLLDILGYTSERLGQWREAYAAYGRSPWPVHRYRAAMARAIAGHPVRDEELVLDESMRRLMARVDGDINQTEITRCMAFLNACLWRPVDDWVVRLELGKLSFRRRRFAEADHHLKRALASAPEGARYSVADLRAVNLTWLTGKQLHSVLEMVPEALRAGQDALHLSTDDDQTAWTRVWMAGQTGDHALIPAALQTWDPYQRAEAYRITGDEDRAVDGWLECLGRAYYYRCAARLIEVLGEVGFRRTAAHLADLVLRESGDDFLALWETAEVLQPLSPELPELGTEVALGRLNDSYRERLVELSRFDFKNAVRSYELMAHAGYQDRAEELRLHAVKHAEGVSELLAVAVLCRRESTAQARQEGLWCLTRALKEARDRLERLETAREFFHYGQIRDARGVLAAERVFTRDTPLSHIEMVAVLQCGSWLTQQEREDLVERAARHLSLDYRSGALGAFPATYGTRLVETVSAFDPLLGRRLALRLDDALVTPASGRTWPGRTEDDWPAVRERVDRAVNDADDSEPVRLAGCLADREVTFGLRFAVCAHLRERLAGLVDEGRRFKPSLPADETPLHQMAARRVGPRTVALCDLWRARLAPADAAAEQAAVAGLQAFFEHERALLAQWERRRRREAEPTLRRTLRAAEALTDSLRALLGPDERRHGHPILRAVYEHVAQDVDALIDETSEQIARTRSELARAHDKGHDDEEEGPL